MNKGKVILICLNYFQVGGVETFVYNQILSLKRKGYTVVVLAKDGIYTDKFKQTGAICVEFEFENKIYYDYEKIEQFISILKKYKVSEVYNNSFQSMNVVMPACLITNTPYVAYTHMSESVIEDEYKFFEEHYETYEDNIKLFYKYADKIIAITPKTKDFIEKKFNIIDKNKVMYMRNSISIEDFKPKSTVKRINDILIISRLEELKYKSVLDGINLYKELYKDNNEMTLTIAGDGNAKEKLEEYVKRERINNVKFLGSISNVKEVMEKCDAVIGVGRCILEAIAMKRLAIISGYTGIRDILSKDNFDIELNDNFAGRHLEEKEVRDISKKIKKLDEKLISEIIEYNYERAKKDLDIDNNIYIIDKENYKYDIDTSDILMEMIKINSTIGKLAEYRFNKMENDWKDHLKYKEWMEEKENNNIKEIKELKDKIDNYERTISFRVIRKIKRIVRKGKINE